MQDHAAELLGNLIRYPHSWQKYKHHLKSEHFHDLGHVFDAMIKAEKRDGELHLKSVIKDLGVDHIQTINHIRDAVISEHRTEWLVDQLRKEKIRKSIMNIADKLRLNAGSQDPNELINFLKDHLDELMNQETIKVIDPMQDYEDFLEHLKQAKHNPASCAGLLTGLMDLDVITSGWQKQDLIVCGGRTSMGKSAFALQNVLNLAKNGHKCLYFSLEMSKRQVYSRLASSAYGMNLKLFRGGLITDEYIDLLEHRDDFWKNILVDDTRAVSADYIAERMWEVKQQYGIDFVVVDYLQDIKETGETTDNQGSALARICRKLRKAAQECDVPVMGMSQVSRDVEKRNDKRPNNADLSGSTGIETSADIILLLYRDEYYNPSSKEPNIVEVLITKHRNGALGLVKLFYDKSTQQIKPLAEIGFTSTYTRSASSEKTKFRRSD